MSLRWACSWARATLDQPEASRTGLDLDCMFVLWGGSKHAGVGPICLKCPRLA